ncbi:chitin synthase CHS3 [Ascoidea rubescens DSM 1968]|uniref:chitin synthase n=1 Tax=Ascoidea rubescens DSM 1968 TaxID=1344418 RepID=A0A1D2VBB4_9ASCO|nr:glycosyltransferase family 2 protein [Ascoidea rubescens DSM 1968]ODV58737.1 glycosyltransferase family 2 protein [Ascoidea rubescens DSM 1968]
MEKKKKTTFVTLWQIYCWIVSFWAPPFLLKTFGGMPKADRQFAWREKIGLISIILYCGAGVAFLTFGFTRTVCSTPPISIPNTNVSPAYMVFNGKAYDLTRSTHPIAEGISAGANVLYTPIDGAGMDGSFLFQNVNGNCKGLITPKLNCSIPFNGEDVGWYMPCKMFNPDGSTQPNFTTDYYEGWACHTSSSAREAFYNLKETGDVYFTWDDMKNTSRNLVVYNGDVLDLSLLNWIQTDDLDYPAYFDILKADSSLIGQDLSIAFATPQERKIGKCLQEIIKVGVIDSETVGCIASVVVLYSSLFLILSVVVSQFLIACYFKWFVATKQGASVETAAQMNERARKIEQWSENPNSQGPIKTVDPKYRPTAHNRSTSKFSFLTQKRHSKLTSGNSSSEMLSASNVVDYHSLFNGMTTMCIQEAVKKRGKIMQHGNGSKRSVLLGDNYTQPAGSIYTSNRLSHSQSILNPFDTTTFGDDEYISRLASDLVLDNIVPQPPIEKQSPFGYPVAHTICLVTCYSEDEEGLRITLDSLSTTDYPNSHKLLLVICDGIIKGSGNDVTTPDVALAMMEDFVIDKEDVQPFSYVAVAHGAKRHNMAKVYAGYYKYDNNTVPEDKQQKVPMVTIVKCGTEAEAGAAKPGNRGKRDSQIILMSFLQKITFDERMTELEFEMLMNIWRVTGLMADMYEIVLMVDADTKVYPDSLTHMIAEMVKDPEVMGLCGETKISNKGDSFTTSIQVFEYFISHHQSKAFESVFGSVTCLPGCFCMYRIKSPRGNNGYWVPILANPDIVERYSDNDISSLHRKNLLLLGEDRYLSTLMLRTFPKRKQIFVPKAACKTLVPDKFKVLLSQRRRWINSTVHNLMELVLVNDLCGTFCFSMQFVIAINLVGTLTLPAAIVFTIYVCIFAIVSKPTPVMSLILLALILGLPAVLIVVTISSLSYLYWMIIYLCALPIWNFVLPTYAYWKFDDFSWGDTRKVQGEAKGEGHGDGDDDEFDATHIVMKRWREFERERKRANISMPDATWDPSATDNNKLLDPNELLQVPADY